MHSYVIRVCDAGSDERQAVIVTPGRDELPRAVHDALQVMLRAPGREPHFPLFIDIHPASQFENVAWMHGVESSASLVSGR